MDMSVLNTRNTTMAGRLTTLESRADTDEAKMGTLASRVATLEQNNAAVLGVNSSINSLTDRALANEASITSLQLTAGSLSQRMSAAEQKNTDQDADISALKAWRGNRANKIASPSAPLTAAVGVSALGLTVVALDFGNQVKTAIQELQAWAASVSSGVFIYRELMKAS
jgi:chromosome segregation ATPase